MWKIRDRLLYVGRYIDAQQCAFGTIILDPIPTLNMKEMHIYVDHFESLGLGIIIRRKIMTNVYLD